MKSGGGSLLERNILHCKMIEPNCTVAKTICADKSIKICVYFSVNPVWHAIRGNGAFVMNLTDDRPVADVRAPAM